MTAGVSVDVGDWGNPGRRGGRSKNNFNYVPIWCSLWKKNILNILNIMFFLQFINKFEKIRIKPRIASHSDLIAKMGIRIRSFAQNENDWILFLTLTRRNHLPGHEQEEKS